MKSDGRTAKLISQRHQKPLDKPVQNIAMLLSSERLAHYSDRRDTTPASLPLEHTRPMRQAAAAQMRGSGVVTCETPSGHGGWGRKTYIKGGRIIIDPLFVSGEFPVVARIGGQKIGLGPMSTSGSLQLPQAQPKSTPVGLPQQKPLSLPTQSGKANDTSGDDDVKSAVKDTPSVPAPITEQALSSMHGIVPTLR